jgi:hypothetical protein
MQNRYLKEKFSVKKLPSRAKLPRNSQIIWADRRKMLNHFFESATAVFGSTLAYCGQVVVCAHTSA